MDPVMLKEQYGDRFIFWGGGVDTQSTLMYGTVEQVKTEVRQRIDIFDGNGGFIFNPVHNIVDGVPVENILAMYETVNEKRNLSNKWK
jgi:uroporphyrinogen-III decarboxylase